MSARDENRADSISEMTSPDPEHEVPSLPWVLPPGRRHSWLDLAAKRAIDLLIAVPALLVLAALFPLISLAIKLDSSGPTMYRARRYGRGGRPITIYKFRSMTADAEQQLEDARHLSNTNGPSFKAPDDPRITRVGRWLRRIDAEQREDHQRYAYGPRVCRHP